MSDSQGYYGSDDTGMYAVSYVELDSSIDSSAVSAGEMTPALFLRRTHRLPAGTLTRP